MMGSGFDSLSLALFTTLAPTGVVAFIVMALTRIGLSGKASVVRIDRLISLPFALSLVGFIASATHLGTPQNALHVFSGVGYSPLSNEVVSAVTFLFLGGSYWMYAFRERFPTWLACVWLAVACMAGVVFIGCTSVAYNVRTVPTWNTSWTPLLLMLSALVAGLVAGLAFLALAKVRVGWLEATLVIAAACTLIAALTCLLFYRELLSGISNNETNALALGEMYSLTPIWFGLGGFISVGIDAWTLRRNLDQQVVLGLRIGAAVVALAAVFAVRLMFYGLYLTVGF